MGFDVPYDMLVLYLTLAFGIGLLGIVLGLKKIAGSPFITIMAGILVLGLLVLVENVEIDYVEAIDYTLNYPMNVTTGTSNVPFTSAATGIAQHIVNTNSLLYDKKISCIIISMSKALSPTGNVIIGILDDDNQVVKQFGSISANTISTTQHSYAFCLPNHDYYILSLYDRIGAKHTTSTGTDFVRVHVDTANPFDGTNSVRAVYTGNWADTTTNDLRMVLIDDNANIIGKPVLKPFYASNELWVYMVFISALFIFIGVSLQIQKWS